MDNLFSDAVRHLLADQCTPHVVRQIERDASGSALWQHLENAGFADALVSEEQGGAGMSLAEIFPVLEQCGRHALPLPLAETMFARACLAQAGLDRPTGSIALAQGRVLADGSIHCATVGCGRVADWVLVSLDSQAVVLPRNEAQAIAASFSLDASLTWPSASAAAATRLPQAVDIRAIQACLYAAQLAGALLWVFERTLAYANERSQFGRPIGKFQAIQHQLAVISEHVFAARMAAQIGCQSETGTRVPSRLNAAIAKARTSEAALEVAALSHSIHGAIGFTEEFDLQLYTRRLHAWRQAGGSESCWHDVAGRTLVDGHSGLTLDLIRTTTTLATL